MRQYFYIDGKNVQKQTPSGYGRYDISFLQVFSEFQSQDFDLLLFSNGYPFFTQQRPSELKGRS